VVGEILIGLACLAAIVMVVLIWRLARKHRSW